MADSDHSGPVTSSAELVAACREDTAVLTERLISAIFTDNPEWTDYSAVARVDLEQGCRRFLGRVLDRVEQNELHAEHDEVAAAIGAHRAVQGVPLEAMLRTFRLGGRIVWEALLDRGGALPAPDFREMGTTMWAVIDGMSSALVTSYRGAELDRVRLDERRRHALIEDVLAGRGRDARFARQSLTDPGRGHDRGIRNAVGPACSLVRPGCRGRPSSPCRGSPGRILSTRTEALPTSETGRFLTRHLDNELPCHEVTEVGSRLGQRHVLSQR
ncbi:hypothetical protein [Nocardia carnea]|uniref:hypothetical protein n=1 Tax=Nocardia carnea TaxID=37328 RepID=UPI002456EEF4|nr:hypothetical protein [Nocardia carnea]